MLRILRNIFVKKADENEEVGLENLEAWLNKKEEELAKRLDDGTKRIKGEIADEINNCSRLLGELESAELMNTKIPHRAKQVIYGNRQAYARKIESFIDGISFDGSNYNKLLEDCDNFDSSLDRIAKATLKGYTILQESFADESSKIAASIREMDVLVRKLRGLILSSKIDSVLKSKELLGDASSKISRKQKIMSEIDSGHKRLEELKKSRDALEKEKADLMNSKDLSKLYELNGKSALLEREINSNKNALTSSFSALEKALKKYSRVAFESQKLAERYLEDPLGAMLHDHGLEILKLLEGVKKAIDSGSIILDDKKRQKSLEVLQSLDRDFFAAFLERHRSLSKEREDVNSSIRGIGIMKEIGALEEKSASLLDSIERIRNGIESMKNDGEKIVPEMLKKCLENDINALLGESISII
ncbi:hypothetical protein J4212_07395 [Candidatus Woesearchaeota archaeon]|nr:hypothetical protein [Candidatus Woesearchaeota archaeon]